MDLVAACRAFGNVSERGRVAASSKPRADALMGQAARRLRAA